MNEDVHYTPIGYHIKAKENHVSHGRSINGLNSGNSPKIFKVRISFCFEYYILTLETTVPLALSK